MILRTSVHEIRILVESYHPLIVVESTEEERIGELLRAVALESRLDFFDWSVTRGLIRQGDPNAIGQTDNPLGVLKHLEGLTIGGIFHLKDFGVHLADARVARKLREVVQHFHYTRSALILTGANVDLPPEVEHRAVYYQLRLPDSAELEEMLDNLVESLTRKHGVVLALDPDDRGAVVDALRGMTLNQARQAVAVAGLEDKRLDAGDIEALRRRRAESMREGGPLEYLPVADNRFELAGFARLKRWLERAQLGYSEKARELNLSPPRGLLLVGVQGCGKSLAAKVIAREWSLPLLKLDAGTLYDKYLGESEKALRRVLAQAESLAPAVLWIDEIEKGLATGDGAESAVSRRLLGYFLTWLQEKQADLFLVATANDVFSLPPELVRKGRFDEIFFVDLPTDAERRRIFEIHLELKSQSPARFALDEVCAASEGFSGAEIEQAVIAALYRALHEDAELATAHILREISETVPLSRSRREEIDRLRELARERFVSVA